jgi:hypothetical protein
LLKQQLSAKRAASNAAIVEEDKPMVNGDNVVPPSVEDVPSSTHVDQTPTVPQAETEPAPPQVETKVSHEHFSSLKPTASDHS